MNRRDRIILQKILGYRSKVDGVHRFFQHDKVMFYDENEGFPYRDAMAMSVFQIGELSKSLSPEIRDAHADIPWGNIIKMREIFAHHYGELNYDILWETSCDDVPALAGKIRLILEFEDGVR